MKAYLKTLTNTNVLLGAGVLLASIVIIPPLKKAARPLAVKGAQGVLYLTDKTSQFVEQSKKSISEYVEEAKTIQENARKKSIEKDSSIERLVEELRDEKDTAQSEINLLKDKIIELEKEIISLRPVEQ